MKIVKPLDDLKGMIESLMDCSDIAAMLQADIGNETHAMALAFKLKDRTGSQIRYVEELERMAQGGRIKKKEPVEEKVNQKTQEAYTVLHHPIPK